MTWLTETSKTDKAGQYGVRQLALQLYPTPQTCPGQGACFQYCLARQSRLAQRYPSINKGRRRRTSRILRDPERCKREILDELRTANAKRKKDGVPLSVRLNAFADLPWQMDHPELFADFPDVWFVDYTKVASRVFTEALPPNLTLILSRTEDNEESVQQYLSQGGSVSVVHDFTLLPRMLYGFPCVDGTRHDLFPLYPKNCVHLLRAIGKKAKADTSGFVLRDGDIPRIASLSRTASSKEAESAMYANAKTWNPFKGCGFDCTYCDPSFQRQSKRQKNRCKDCYDYRPHWHEHRLASVPSSEIVFVAGNSDICFCRPADTRKIIARIKEHDKRAHIAKTYYFQSKRPQYFEQFLTEFPENAILLMTLETNRDADYSKVSKAPPPSVRYEQFKALNYPRKVVTIEPILDFDLEPFLQMLTQIAPEYVWIGFNSHPDSVPLPEPTEDKVAKLLKGLRDEGIPVKPKDLRGIDFDAI